MPLTPLTPFLEDLIEIRFGGVEEFADFYTSQLCYFFVYLLYRSSAFVAFDKDV